MTRNQNGDFPSEIKNNLSEEPDIDDELEFEMEMDEAEVEVIDGVLIQGDEEEVRLLFYHEKPYGVDNEDEVRRCKGLVEFRTSRTTFNAIVKNLSDYSKSTIPSLKKFHDHSLQEKLPMFG